MLVVICNFLVVFCKKAGAGVDEEQNRGRLCSLCFRIYSLLGFLNRKLHSFLVASFIGDDQGVLAGLLYDFTRFDGFAV